MFANRSIESWYTAGRVSMAIANHHSPEFDDGGIGAVELVYDVDHAIEILPPRLRKIADLCLRRDYFQGDVARMERCGQPRVFALLDEARKEIRDFLCTGVI